jgi:hypothetical protein
MISHGRSGVIVKFYDKFLVRLNTNRGSVEYLELDLSKYPLLTYPDESVDLVTTLLYPLPAYYDYLSILQDYFTNRNILLEKNIREGSGTDMIEECSGDIIVMEI